MFQKFEKLKKRSFEELRVRGSQKVAAFGERHGLSRSARLLSDLDMRAALRHELKNKLTSPDFFLEYFRTREHPRFFASFDDLQDTIKEIKARWPTSLQTIIERADRLTASRFDLLGFADLNFGDPVDWQFEPMGQKRAPLVHWSKLNYLDPAAVGDKKIIWELNRHQYFVTLGQAYHLTCDERYVRTFVTHLESWMEQNPPKLGINWASSLEIAFRSISWLWAFHFFKDSPSLPSSTFMRAMKFLYLNASHLETYLSTFFSPNTHLTGEALGLFYLGTMLPEFKRSESWRETGKRILLEQLSIHVKEDGVYFEQSSYYHRYTTDFYTHFLVLARANGELVSSDVVQKLGALLDHLMYITRPDGTTPFFGDDDGGRLMMLDHRPANDFRAALSTGAALFDRTDYKYVADGPAEETLWLLGRAGLQNFDSIIAKEPAKQSVAFGSGGYYVMRDGWAGTSNYLLFDCGPHGYANCGHAHADALSFELAANGRTLLVDPGTYTYTGSSDLRDWFRSSAAHNTLTVDGESSSVTEGPFSWSKIAGSRRVSWIPQRTFDYVSAEHDGFRRIPGVALHTRSILFLKNNYWVVRDHVASRGGHDLKLWFHFDAGVAPLSSRSNEVYVLGENGHTTRLQLTTFATGGDWSTEQGWVSSCYGERKEAPVFAFSILATGPEELVTFLLPQVTGGHPRPVVREIEAIEGRAFEIRIGEKLDLLLIRSVPSEGLGFVETPRLASDFDLTWVRFSSERARIPEELVLIGGRRLEFEGREILQSMNRIDYLSIGAHGDRWRRESEEGVVNLSLPISDLDSLWAALNEPGQAVTSS